MDRFSYKGCINITINENLTLSDIEMHVLHPIRADVSISPEIKLFISENIDLLPHEIYKRLVVERGLDLNIRQKQIYFCPNVLGWLTSLWDVLQNSQFKIREIGVDATLWKFMNKHLHQHPLIPPIDGQFLSLNSI
ncbi:5833_t:CDS:2 [Funneliformis geosporum]|uniref:5833_t:CDS:1 n=1 Tax=Funneliformis geosporum TaxID=1117311 RepID=A0A9W4WNJ3_9GLOM|nr:5833_t:CDS:2 [Funneliformis geosporum]